MHDRGEHELAAPHAELRLVGGRHRHGNRHVTTAANGARRTGGRARTHPAAAASAGRESGGSHRHSSSKPARRHRLCRHKRLHQGGAVTVVIAAVVPHTGRGGGNGAHPRLMPLLLLPVPVLLRRRRAVYPGGITVHEELRLLLLPMVTSGNGTPVVVLLVVAHVVAYNARWHVVHFAASLATSNTCDVPKPGVPPLHHHNLLMLLLERLHARVLLGHHVSGVVRRRKAWPTTHSAAALHVLVQRGLLLLLAHVLHQKQTRITEVPVGLPAGGRKLRHHDGSNTTFEKIRRTTNISQTTGTGVLGSGQYIMQTGRTLRLHNKLQAPRPHRTYPLVTVRLGRAVLTGNGYATAAATADLVATTAGMPSSSARTARRSHGRVDRA